MTQNSFTTFQTNKLYPLPLLYSVNAHIFQATDINAAPYSTTENIQRMTTTCVIIMRN